MIRPILILELLACLLAPLSATVADEITLVTFGDSTTAPRGELKIFARLIEKQLAGKGVRVVNAGVGGNTTSKARARFETEVLAHQPGIVVVQFGINDAAVDVWKDPPMLEPRVALADYEANLRFFVSSLRAHGAGTVLMTPNPLRWTEKLRNLYGKPPYKPAREDGFNEVLREYAESVRKIAKEEGVDLVDIYAAFQNAGPERLLLDGMHPNEAGHRLVADALLPVLRKALKGD